ncbi:hypothetical protein PIIN_09900, partial [Serendipita indica DSM 11827]
DPRGRILSLVPQHRSQVPWENGTSRIRTDLAIRPLDYSVPLFPLKRHSSYEPRYSGIPNLVCRVLTWLFLSIKHVNRLFIRDHGTSSTQKQCTSHKEHESSDHHKANEHYRQSQNHSKEADKVQKLSKHPRSIEELD